MKRFPKVTQCVFYIMGVTGVYLVMNTVANLISYHKNTVKYIEQVELYVDRIVKGRGMPEDEEYRMQLQEFFNTKLSQEEFQQHLGLINRALMPNPAPSSIEDRMQLSSARDLLHRRGTKKLPEHPEGLIILGVGLLFVSTYLQKKLKPKPETQVSTSQI